MKPSHHTPSVLHQPSFSIWVSPCIFLQTHYHPSSSNWFSYQLICQDDKHTILTSHSSFTIPVVHLVFTFLFGVHLWSHAPGDSLSSTCTSSLCIQSPIYLRESFCWYKCDIIKGRIYLQHDICPNGFPYVIMHTEATYSINLSPSMW